MAINRAPFNALVDDDGTNQVGTPWNKQAIKDVILDPVDAALTGGAGSGINADKLDGLDSTQFVKTTDVSKQPWTVLNVSLAPGDLIDWNPGFVGDSIVYVTMLGSGSRVINLVSLAPGLPGQMVHIHLISDPAASIVLFHEHVASGAGCMLHCRKSPYLLINGFWAYSEFQYGTYGGVPAWTQLGYGNGIGGA